MTYWKKLRVAAAGAVLLGAAVAMAQTAPKTPEPGKVIVSLYRVAPGKHLDFLKWMATREAISKEAGVGSVQWYAHTNGDSWDFVAIAPETTPQEDAKVDELTKRKGLKTEFAAALEFRQFIAYHTDTFARGPLSAADLIRMAGGSK
jgi:hypothetical protein